MKNSEGNFMKPAKNQRFYATLAAAAIGSLLITRCAGNVSATS